MEKSELTPAHLRRMKSLALLNDAQLASFLNYVDLVQVPHSGTVIIEGQPGDSMYLILQGQLRVYSQKRSGEAIFLRLLEAGDAFGEIALLNHAVRSASVEAARESYLVKISSDALGRLMAEQPSVAAHFLFHLARSLGTQLTTLTKKLRNQLEVAGAVSFLE